MRAPTAHSVLCCRLIVTSSGCGNHVPAQAHVVSYTLQHNHTILPPEWRPIMFESPLTRHTARRLQQRGIPEDVLTLLMQFASHEYDKRGARLVCHTGRNRQRLRGIWAIRITGG